MHRAMLALLGLWTLSFTATAAEPGRTLAFRAQTREEAVRWQGEARRKLFERMMGGRRPERVAPDVRVLRRIEVPAGGYALEELTLASLPDRRVHAWLAVPLKSAGKVGGVLALHGHGGKGEEIVRGQSLYGYGRTMIEMGYVVIAPDIGSHDLQHKDWSLMGERVWDSLACLDYLASRPEVDAGRLAVAGLSLGGETTMYVAALDERIRVACSSGWLTTVANMKQGHCPCWQFPGLEQHFDFADIFACTAPRMLVCEIGARERAPGGFPVDQARKAFAEIQKAYGVFDAGDRAVLDIHPGGHVFHGVAFWGPLREALGTPAPWAAAAATDDEALRRGEIARRAFLRARGVVEGWWAHRDPGTGLLPRRLDQPVWAPQDNAADMMPFLFLTAHFLAPERMPDLLALLKREQELTNRVGVLPDWYSLRDRRWVHEKVDVTRLVFNASEYCKDGLIPMTEVMGRGPWTARMMELTDAILEKAPVASDFGPLPADDTEVNGNMLQVLARVYAMTREPKYLAAGVRIGDAYVREVLPGTGGLPPHRWDFRAHTVLSDRLSLNDHSNELVGGLAEMYAIVQKFDPEREKAWRPVLRNMFQRLLAKACNEDGLFVQLVQATTGKVLDGGVPDTWGYALAATQAFGMATEDAELLAAAPRALRALESKPRYLAWGGADDYADCIEGGLLLLNRVPEPEGFRWLDRVLPFFLAKQQADGVVEGWYGDGNYARTALMVGLYGTRGTAARPWREDLRLGAVPAGKGVRVVLAGERAWEGRLAFDRPRHRLHLGLPRNLPRLNEFPEWFTVEPDVQYLVAVDGRARTVAGADLAAGLPVAVKAGGRTVVEVTPP